MRFQKFDLKSDKIEVKNLYYSHAHFLQRIRLDADNLRCLENSPFQCRADNSKVCSTLFYFQKIQIEYSHLLNK